MYTEFALRGSRLFRRMHNKAWIADNRVAIIGGRNVGDEYFGAAQQSNFADLDVVLTGPVVEEVSRSFDAYWNSSHAVPVSRFDSREPQPGELQALVHYAQDYGAQVHQMPYVAALLDPEQRTRLIAAATPPLKVRDIRLLVDDPEKVGKDTSGSPAEISQVLAGLDRTIGDATQEVLLISPYLVPGKEGSRDLVDDVARGLHVRVLTNSLAATDVAAVHSGYARYRRELLRGGVELYEMKPQAQGEGEQHHISAIGSSNATLHTKAMVVDRRWAFVGSMNLDPRSAILNTEMGVLVDSPELAEQLREQFDFNASPDLSYRPALEKHDELVWYDRHDGRERRSEHEPDASVGRRLSVTLIRLLPIESQL
jgi:putative cardiolipin synthase